MPMTVLIKIQYLAFLEYITANWRSPHFRAILHSALLTMAMIPNGKKQQMVVKIAHAIPVGIHAAGKRASGRVIATSATALLWGWAETISPLPFCRVDVVSDCFCCVGYLVFPAITLFDCSFGINSEMFWSFS